jgi:LmbE family N-acetylglucosaminyl deacetylase
MNFPSTGRLILCSLLFASYTFAQAAQVFTDNVSYNVGDEVKLQIVLPKSETAPASLQFSVTLRYLGESEPVSISGHSTEMFGAPLKPNSASEPTTGYRDIWHIPANARTGRYQIEVAVSGPTSQRAPSNSAASFVVHRKLVQIKQIDLDKSSYTSGDQVDAAATLRNLTNHSLDGLRVEFSDRYWPWIAQSSERAGVEAVALSESLSLPAGGQVIVRSYPAAVVGSVSQPSIHQYAVVVWDRQRKEIYDIGFSPLVIIHPAGINSPEPYPSQYLYPELNAVNVSSYRHFYPAADSPAIDFDHSHTMYAPGTNAMVNFSVFNLTAKPWRDVAIRARLLTPDNSELANRLVEEKADLEPGGAPLKEEAKFALPAAPSGIYRAQIEISDISGQVLATNSLELGVNPLPKSILIFCAHQDDEGAHSGIIRAAIENRIPIHFVYFTSGDAGSCDRYYEHSCGPAEALNFGALRMEEARAALGHLGVPREDIYFFGLPDGGSGQIWYDHRSSSSPYLSVLLASDHAPYEGLARPNLPYARDAVVETAKEFIKKFQPEVVYTSHPDERHVDHRTDNWFVVKALQELVREGSVSPDLVLRVDQVYGPGPQAHAPYHYQKDLLYVSGEAMALAQEAQWFYQSQGGNRAEGNLRTFDRLPRTEIHWQVLDWKDHEGWNERN